MVNYDIQKNGASTQLVIELEKDSVYIDSSFIAYIIGDLKLEATDDPLSSKILAHFIGSQYFKPRISGSGKIYLKSTLGSYHIFNLKHHDSLVISPNVFICCHHEVKIDNNIKPTIDKFLSGTPMINSVVNGDGNVVALMPGPVIELKLNNDKFVAYNKDIAAYSSNLKITREPAGSGWLGVAQTMVKIYRGTGSIYFSPHPNKDSKVDIK